MMIELIDKGKQRLNMKQYDAFNFRQNGNFWA